MGEGCVAIAPRRDLLRPLRRRGAFVIVIFFFFFFFFIIITTISLPPSSRVRDASLLRRLSRVGASIAAAGSARKASPVPSTPTFPRLNNNCSCSRKP